MTEVQLFSTCLAEEFFPEVNDAAATVLERLRLKVTPIRGAFCCGQVAFNEGMREQAVDLARRFLNSVQPGVPIVVPSGSCTSMLKIFYGDLLADDPALAAKAAAIRPWVFELSQFLVNVVKVKYLGARYERAVAYHPSCHLMRELGVRAEPMTLLSAVGGNQDLRAARSRGMLRLRRDVLGEVPAHLGVDARRQDGAHQRERRRGRSRERLRMPDADWRRLEPRGREDRGAASGGSARGEVRKSRILNRARNARCNRTLTFILALTGRGDRKD